jgi:hypothetical protein
MMNVMLHRDDRKSALKMWIFATITCGSDRMYCLCRRAARLPTWKEYVTPPSCFAA